MRTACPNCHKQFKSPDEQKGKKAKCTQCDQIFILTPVATKCQGANIIEYQCNHCGKNLKLRDEIAGKACKCPACKEVIVIPKNKITVIPKVNNVSSESYNKVVKNQEAVSVICVFCKKTMENSSGWPIETMHQVLNSGGLFGKMNATMKQFSGGIGGLMPGTMVTYKTCQVRIPRCEQCKTAHEQQDEFKKKHIFKSFFGENSLPKELKPWSCWTEFSEVKNLVKAGWKLGREPEEKYGYNYMEVP